MADQVDLVLECPAGGSGSPLRALGLTILCLAGFVCAGGLIRSLIPPEQGGPGLETKFAHLAQHPDRYDTIFVGSSRTQHQVDPALFDRILADHDRSSSSFNFGVGGMRALETEYILGELLALDLPRLEWVFIDPGFIKVDVEDANLFTTRVLNWHDAAATFRSLEFTVLSPAPLSQKLWQIRNHITALAYNLGSVGRGASWLERRRQFLRDRGSVTLQPDDYNGYKPLDLRLDPSHPGHRKAAKRRHDFERNLDRYHEAVEALARPAAVGKRWLRHAERAYLIRLVRALERRGVRFVFFVAPTETEGQHFLLEAARDGILPVLFFYANPQAYPELYDPAHRFDASHLNEIGARYFTTHLAHGFLAHLAQPEAQVAQTGSRR